MIKFIKFATFICSLILFVSCTQASTTQLKGNKISNVVVDREVSQPKTLDVLNYTLSYEIDDFDILRQNDPYLYFLHSSSVSAQVNRTIAIYFYPKNVSPENYASVTPEIKRIAEDIELQEICTSQELQRYISQCTIFENVAIPHAEFYILHPTLNPFDYEEILAEEGLVTYDQEGEAKYPPLFSYPEKAALFYTGLPSNPILLISTYLIESPVVNSIPLTRDEIEILLGEIEINKENEGAIRRFEKLINSLQLES